MIKVVYTYCQDLSLYRSEKGRWQSHKNLKYVNIRSLQRHCHVIIQSSKPSPRVAEKFENSRTVTTKAVKTSMRIPTTMVVVAKDSGSTKLEVMPGGGTSNGIVDREVPEG